MQRLVTYVGENSIAPPPGVGFDSIASPVLGMAVLLSHIMSFCIRNPVYPLTDNAYYWQLLQNKFHRLVASGENELIVKRLEAETKSKISGLGLEVIDVELPQLSIKTFEDALHIRQKHKDELARFRLEIAKFSNFASNQFWSDDFMRECSEIAVLKINPAMLDLQNSLRLSKDKVLIDAFKLLRTGAPVIPLVGTLLAGFPL